VTRTALERRGGAAGGSAGGAGIALRSASKPPAGRRGEFVAIISGYHVDDYCLQGFKKAVRVLKERLAAEKITDFANIGTGDLIARVPPKITSGEKAGEIRQIPVYRICALGDDFDSNGDLVHTGESDHLYFQADCIYLLDLNAEELTFTVSGEHDAGAIDYFDARDLGRMMEQYGDLAEDLKGILYRIPSEAVTGIDREAPCPPA